MDVSVIIPLFNESESLKELDDWISLSFKYKDLDYEVVYIDDGSNDSSWDIVKSITQNNSNRKGISFIKNYGKSQALHAGFNKALGEVVFTMDSDDFQVSRFSWKWQKNMQFQVEFQAKKNGNSVQNFLENSMQKKMAWKSMKIDTRKPTFEKRGSELRFLMDSN